MSKWNFLYKKTLTEPMIYYNSITEPMIYYNSITVMFHNSLNL
jgi:hypothetical protein